MTQSVELETHEWQQVISVLAMANPLVAKISAQLVQHPVPSGPGAGQGVLRPGSVEGIRHGNSKEPHHEF